MKKVLVVFASLLLSICAAAQEHRDLLLTPDGTLFVAERQWTDDHPEASVSGISFIRLSIRVGEEQRELIVPGTEISGKHASPALAYDAESQRLFVFWQRSASLLHSELLFQSMSADGQWSPASSFGGVTNMRENLTIAITRKAEFVAENGTVTIVPQINVHAVWWETNTYDGIQSANYAMLAIENGQVVENTIHRVRDLGDREHVSAGDPDAIVPDVLKHPSVTVNPQQDGVSIVYGDIESGSLERVAIKPRKVVGDARVHIPVGRYEGRLGTPRLNLAADARVTTLAGPDGRLGVYTVDGDRVRYTLYTDGLWSDAREIHLDEKLSKDSAIDAVRRLVQD